MLFLFQNQECVASGDKGPAQAPMTIKDYYYDSNPAPLAPSLASVSPQTLNSVN